MEKYYDTSRTGKPEGTSASTRSREFAVISSVSVVGGDLNRTPAAMRREAIFRILYSQAASRKNYTDISVWRRERLSVLQGHTLYRDCRLGESVERINDF